APGLFTLLLCVVYAMLRRGTSPARNPLSGNEVYVLAARYILTNTLEQYVLHLVSQLVLAAYVDALTLIKVVPLLAVFFLFGRITFILGYPLQRGFGWFVTLFPNIATV
ncbi:hypothetical protein B4U79_00368, partial [Dinothrombium tinctorium]